MLQKWVEEDAQKVKKKRRTSKRMYKILVKEHGYQGAEATLRAYVGKLRGKVGKKVYIPLAYEPGETAQVDFGEAEVIIAGEVVTAHIFVMWLGYSSATFVQAYPAEKQEVFMAGHVAAFEFFGGVPGEIWYDNLKIAVKKVLKGRNREEQDSWTSFRTHYLFRAEYCNVRSGWEKGGVEGRVGYARRNWLIPTPEFESWQALNEYLRQECEAEKERQIRGRPATIGIQLAQEQAQFLPLPAQEYACCCTLPVKANKLSLVTFATNRYSVPTRQAHEKLLLRAYVDHIEISNGQEVVATHPRCWQREQDILNPHHYLDLLKQRTRAFAHAQTIRQWQQSWPPIFDIYFDSLKERYESAEATRLFIGILQLSQTISERELATALQEALSYHCFRLAGIEEIIRRQQERPPVASIPLPNHPHLADIQVTLPNLQQFDSLLSWEQGRKRR
jgi:transposase